MTPAEAVEYRTDRPGWACYSGAGCKLVLRGGRHATRRDAIECAEADDRRRKGILNRGH
jgi:hypothetical protein